MHWMCHPGLPEPKFVCHEGSSSEEDLHKIGSRGSSFPIVET